MIRAVKYIVAGYVAFMVLYWIQGSYTPGWTLAYYSVEKLMSASGFILLAVFVDDKRIMHTALYAASVCVFMWLYFIFCTVFGHSSIIAVTSFLFYSLIVLYLITRK